jgi:Activator of Hsp90 ATPase homolog 1-like protein
VGDAAGITYLPPASQARPWGEDVGHELRLERLFDAPPEVDRPRRLVYRHSIFSGEWGRSVDSTVTVNFEEHNGRTLFTLLQTGSESQEVRDAFNSHAPGFLDSLQRAVAAKLVDRQGR